MLRKLAFLLISALLLAWLAATLWTLPALAGSDEPTPEPGGEERVPVTITDRLAAPPMPENPSQADKGAQVYYGVCMACHGDRGQGLTDEWREIWEEDANCWQSGCHGPDHPPWGFTIPETCCTAVLGSNTLTRFQNGQELFDYITETMPWWNPGYLKTEEFWQVTAYLMREHGGITNEIDLDGNNAGAFSVNPATPPPGDLRNNVLAVSGILIVTAAAVFLHNRKR